MKHALLSFLLLAGLLAGTAQAQQTLYFPPPPAVGTWATTTPQSLGWCQPQLDSLYNFLGRKHTKSFIVLKDGRLVLERYYGTYTQDSVHYWASAGKSLTAMLVGIAQQESLLSLTDSTSRTLGRGWTSAPARKEGRITLRHQLTMTTGLDDTPPAPCDNESTSPGCLLYRTDAGTRWAYHTGPYRRLLDVVAQASGLAINQFTNQRLASRIGMSGAWANGIYYSRARDMARFGLLALARGTWNGAAILRDTAYFRQMTTPSQPLNRSYGYLWWLNGQSSYQLPGPQQTVFSGPLIPTAPADLVAALGKNDQKIYVVPSLGLVVVRQGNSADSPRLAVSSFDTELWRYLMAAMQCRPLATQNAIAQAAAQVFPNPATQTLTVSAVPAARRLCLLDATGRVVRELVVAGEASMSVAELPAGLYLLHWLSAESRVLAVRRVVKQ
ncbi:Por secretion system C-terminal sorting domain-containing protein [Hymenobacter daecheongensis DSM 21074]|uniref:Por secretion system C-terminal sorting domain-containing protein n=1 Tax=Hymenobacter daecheongensis DSM 21074 TaxID=1121955 RepID=A0A1M6GZL8_9BACT|nr:serine hydrolase [Hymenobacter daecheongensis]SHJ15417.1 Por secretion system C-terminal sorting domain-containing protein [Hymenobacter daecheongensis DSM 21074]